MKVSEVMRRTGQSLGSQSTVLQAAQAMETLSIEALPVCEEERVIGIITCRDILRCVTKELPPASTLLGEVMADQLAFAFEDEDLNTVIARMHQDQIRELPVLDRTRRIVGMFSIGIPAT